MVVHGADQMEGCGLAEDYDDTVICAADELRVPNTVQNTVNKL